jgi:hypothetical protein
MTATNCARPPNPNAGATIIMEFDSPLAFHPIREKTKVEKAKAPLAIGLRSEIPLVCTPGHKDLFAETASWWVYVLGNSLVLLMIAARSPMI